MYSKKAKIGPYLKPSANERKKNTKQKGLAHPRFIVCVTQNQKKCFAKLLYICFGNQTVFDSRNIFSSEYVRNNQSTIYLKSHDCVHGFQHEKSLINVYRVRYPETAHFEMQNRLNICLIRETLCIVSGDADECEKQFRFVFRICLAFLTSVCAGL